MLVAGLQPRTKAELRIAGFDLPGTWIHPPLEGVQTGDMVDRCSETSWTLSTANQGGCRMPFHEVSRMDARLEFVMLASVEGANVRSLSLRDQPDERLLNFTQPVFDKHR